MQDLSAHTLVTRIEGLPGGHCWPVVPDYGTALDYTPSLRDPLPRGLSAGWNPIEGTSSIGGWTFNLRPESRWYAIQPRPLGRVATVKIPADSSPEPLHDLDGVAALLGIGTYVIIDRETLRVVDEFSGGGGIAASFARAQYGSEAAAHRVGAFIWAVATPPALAGRLVTLYRVPRTGGSQAVSEVQANVLLRGRIPPEGDVVQDRGHQVQLRVEDRGSEAEFGRDATAYLARVGTSDAVGLVSLELVRAEGAEGPRVPAPLHHAAGAYIYVPELEIVCGVPYAAGAWEAGSRVAVWGEPGTVAVDQAGDHPAYQVLWSDPAGDYPTFGRTVEGVLVASANPTVIARNLLESFDGTRSDYDRGTYLYPTYSLGLHQSRLDTAAWQEAEAVTGHLQARALWLGGPKSRKALDVIRGLMALAGYAVLVTRAGLWRPVRMGDVYPGEGRAVTATDGLSGWKAVGRQLDRVVIECDPGPNQESARSVQVNDLTASEWFPREAGGSRTIALAPYMAADIEGQASEVSTALSVQLRRYGQRMAEARANFGPTDALGMEPGDALLVTDPLMRDPSTGLRDQGAIPARPTQIGGDVYTGQAEATLALLANDLRLANRCPSAEVMAWDAATLTLTFKRQRYAKRGQFDAQQFEVGDAVALYSRNWVALSDTTGAFDDAYVDAVVGVRHIRLTAALRNAAGATVVPVAGDILSYAYYQRARDSGPVNQTGYHAWMAAGGLAAPLIDGEAPYQFGS